MRIQHVIDRRIICQIAFIVILGKGVRFILFWNRLITGKWKMFFIIIGYVWSVLIYFVLIKLVIILNRNL